MTKDTQIKKKKKGKENEREEKIKKKNLGVNLLELIMMQKNMIFLLRLVK